ncbi:1-deoxy-D-xylulose 5-phosphate reductoisomerase [Rickettsiales bacterium]|nr:1-deoxy-D-xylulose 5-phosphate reductoisomerase [Rickettsiales bacterium]
MIINKDAGKTVSILGSTGVIGRKTLRLLNLDKKHYKIVALTANRNFALLAQQTRLTQPEIVAIADSSCYKALKQELGSSVEILAGEEGLEYAASAEADWIMSAITGFAALVPTMAAIKCCKTLALANKEALVCAGQLLVAEAKASKVNVIPVDSEHNAIFQILQNNTSQKQIESITLTASGGPFYQHTLQQMQSITPEEALNHPTWSMGGKITIDSATIMNKGLEIIEAHHLFSLSPSQIKVVIHPESILHGLVNFCDGSATAVLSHPDMDIPISTSFSWPQRTTTQAQKLDLAQLGQISFTEPDERRFPALKLAKEALAKGGNYPIALNAANEVAVRAFLDHEIRFLDIMRVIEEGISKITHQTSLSLPEIIRQDETARQTARKIISSLYPRKQDYKTRRLRALYASS